MPKLSKEEKTRKVIYKTVASELCKGKDAITQTRAKQILGWQEEDGEKKGGKKFKEDFLLKVGGTKVRCTNNVTNRPIYGAILKTLEQEHLRKRWRFNGEPIIIGKTGLVLNGQHTLISLILACKAWEDNPDKYPDWDKQPAMEKLLISGIDESDEVVNTMDTCKPRSLTDVIYRSAYFAGMKGKARREVARITDYAVKLLWHRTGAKLDAYALRRTHSESLDFIARHPKLLECVRHIHEENEEKRIQVCISTGYAAGLLYLMGSSKTDPTTYYVDGERNETSLDWNNWSKACDYFVEIAGNTERIGKPIRQALGKMLEEGINSTNDRVALIVAGWTSYDPVKALTPQQLKIDYSKTLEGGDGTPVLIEMPTVGGIDCGDEGPEVVTEVEVPEEEVEKSIKELSKKKTKKAKDTAQIAHRAGERWAEGDTAWVRDNGDEAYFGTVTCAPFPCGDKKYRINVSADDGEWEVLLDSLALV
jgi:hypothetical protein